MTTTTTSALAAPIAMIFSFNEPFVYQALSGLTDDERGEPRATCFRQGAYGPICADALSGVTALARVLREP